MPILEQKLFAKSILYAVLYQFNPQQFSNLSDETMVFWRLFLNISVAYQLILAYLTCNYRLFEFLWVRNPAWFSKVSPAMVKNGATSDNIRERISTQITSLIHAGISSILAIYINLNPSLLVHKDHMFGKTFVSQFHGVHTAAVFFTELIEMIGSRQYETTMDKLMIVHHAIGVYAFSISAFGIGNYYMSLVLLSELSNPFLSARALLLIFDYGSFPIFKIVEYSFAATFIFVRIFLGYFYMTPIVVNDLFRLSLGQLDTTIFPLWDGKDLDLAVKIARTCLSLMVVFHLLNGYFLSHITKALIRNFRRNTRSSAK